MFARARRRLTLRYLGLLVVVLVAFSVIFFVVLSLALQPAFDIAPELSDEQASHEAYRHTLERIAIALLIADVAVLVVVGVVAWLLADRTLRPIRDAHERQRRFVADASHEMRTPLAIVRTTAESALLPESDTDTKTAALQTIASTSERMSRLTNDLLLLARSETGVLAPAMERIDLSVVVAEAIDGARATARDPTPQLDVSLAEDLLVLGSPAEVGRMVSNLIDNALRYGVAPVRVRTFAQGPSAVLEVADQGPGIAAADLQHIFEPFFRVRSHADARDGSGLGLAIVADLARQHHGRVMVDSRPGSGSRFRLELPRFT